MLANRTTAAVFVSKAALQEWTEGTPQQDSSCAWRHLNRVRSGCALPNDVLAAALAATVAAYTDVEL